MNCFITYRVIILQNSYFVIYKDKLINEQKFREKLITKNYYSDETNGLRNSEEEVSSMGNNMILYIFIMIFG